MTPAPGTTGPSTAPSLSPRSRPSRIPVLVAVLAIVGVVVGELFGARAGLGFLIFTAGQTFDVPQLFVGVITLAVLGMVLTFGMKWIENWIARWRRSPLED